MCGFPKTRGGPTRKKRFRKNGVVQVFGDTEARSMEGAVREHLSVYRCRRNVDRDVAYCGVLGYAVILTQGRMLCAQLKQDSARSFLALRMIMPARR